MPDTFDKLDIRVGRVVDVELESRTPKPTYKMEIDFGKFGKRVGYGRFTRHPIEEVKDRLVLGVLNFAHGSFYMIGAYCCFSALGLMGNNFWLGLIVGPLLVCAVGFVVERFFLRYVYHLELPYQLLLTFAFVLLFDDLVKIVWGAG